MPARVCSFEMSPVWAKEGRFPPAYLSNLFKPPDKAVVSSVAVGFLHWPVPPRDLGRGPCEGPWVCCSIWVEKRGQSRCGGFVGLQDGPSDPSGSSPLPARGSNTSLPEPSVRI